MIQFVATPHPTVGLAEQVQQAISHGCAWVHLAMPAEATDAEVAEAARELTPICRDSGTILVIEQRTQVVMDTLVHGVALTAGMDAAEAREFLGPNAIVGAAIAEPSEAVKLAKSDIDYALLPARFSAAEVAAMVSAVRAAGAEEFPLVAIAPAAATAEQVAELRAAGANAIAVTYDTLLNL